MLPSTSNKARTIFRAQLVALTVLSFWRIWICLWEYDTGPFVSVPRTLLDQAPFWALVGLVAAAYVGWHRATKRASQLLLFGASMLLITAADLVIFNGTARESLYTGSWAGEAHVSSAEDTSWSDRASLSVTFTPDQQVVFAMGTGLVPIHRGEWHIAFDPLRCSQTVTLHGFGRGDYWNKEDLYVRGSFRMGDRPYQLCAQLRHVRKRPA
jgi:hypothetical protein